MQGLGYYIYLYYDSDLFWPFIPDVCICLLRLIVVLHITVFNNGIVL